MSQKKWSTKPLTITSFNLMACVKAILQVEPAPFSFSRLSPSSCMELINRMSSMCYTSGTLLKVLSEIYNLFGLGMVYEWQIP